MFNKISTLVSNQVPAFVKEEHPKFISFLEAYYEFLEQEYPEISVTNNNLQEKIDELRYVSDVDSSLEKFEEHFYNSFLPYLPRNVATSKEVLIKNILPLYLSKGSEKSFQLLFRMLFDENIKIEYPRDNILRASDGRWSIEKILNVSNNFYSEYVSDGERTTYILPEKYATDEFSVYVNDVLNTNYIYYREYAELTFNTAPAESSTIKIIYSNFDTKLLTNRKITGKSSGATSIIEKVTESRSTDTVFFELFIDNKNTVGTFINNEILESTIFFNNSLLTINYTPYSIIDTIYIIDGGASYNIGDAVPIYGTAAEDAIAVIDSVTSGVIENLFISYGGIGFKVNNDISAIGYSSNSFSGYVQTVDDSGVFSSNTIIVNDDIIANLLSESISNVWSQFPANASATYDSSIANTLAFREIANLGSITSLVIETSTINSTLSPDFDVTPEVVGPSDLNLRDLSAIGKIDINEAGQNYAVGEYLIFTRNGSFSGYGANAEIAAVDFTGAITQIKINSGGLSYQKDHFPTITIDTVSGTGANLTVSGIMGDEEVLLAELADGIAGSIQSIKLIYPGLNYEDTPVVDLSQFGNGEAVAQANLKESVVTLPGRWKTSDGKLSNRDINLQGRDYYIDFSYVITSKVEFKKYKEIVKNLLHPSGLINYANYSIVVEASSPTSINIESSNSLIYFANTTTITVDSSAITADMR